jgi:hypothetical protein
MARICFILAYASGLLGALYGLGIIGYQCLTWLQYGYWPPVPIYAAFDQLQIGYPVVQWVGVQRLIFHVLLWPAGPALLIAGSLGAYVFGSLGGEIQQQAQLRRELRGMRKIMGETD